MRLNFTSKAKVVGFFLVVTATLVLTALAAGKGNEFWTSPLIGLGLMMFLGTLPTQGPDNQFEWVYVLLAVCSGVLLMYTSEQVYWTSPLLLGVIVNIFLGGVNIKVSTEK